MAGLPASIATVNQQDDVLCNENVKTEAVHGHGDSRTILSSNLAMAAAMCKGKRRFSNGGSDLFSDAGSSPSRVVAAVASDDADSTDISLHCSQSTVHTAGRASLLPLLALQMGGCGSFAHPPPPQHAIRLPCVYPAPAAAATAATESSADGVTGSAFRTVSLKRPAAVCAPCGPKVRNISNTRLVCYAFDNAVCSFVHRRL